MLPTTVQGVRYAANIIYDKGGETSHVRISPEVRASKHFYDYLQYSITGDRVIVRHKFTTGNVTVIDVLHDDGDRTSIEAYHQFVLMIAQDIVQVLDDVTDMSNDTTWYS